MARPADPARSAVRFRRAGRRGRAAAASAAVGRIESLDVHREQAGAAGNIGVGIAARSEPDGYTVLITSNTIVINPLLYKSVPYDLERDFLPLVDIAGSPTAFCVNPKSGINSVAELIALAKQKPGGINYSSAGFATPAHLAAEFFRSRSGIQMTHVPFNGAGPANQALIAGTVDMASGALPASHPHIVAGTLKGIAVTGEKRWFDLPNVPTMVRRAIRASCSIPT